MVWAGARKKRLPPDWEARRSRVLARDGYQCTHTRVDTGARCVEPASDVDHIVPGDDHSLSNLRALCRWHHARKSSAEGAAARRPRARKRRPQDKHPGLL